MADINKVCIDCGQRFSFTDAEQSFYKKNNFVDPKRCIVCRRQAREHWAAAKHDGENPDEAPTCFDCNPVMVRGVKTNDKRECLACGRYIPEGTNQYVVIRPV